MGLSAAAGTAAGAAAGAAAAGSGLFLAVLFRFTVLLERLWHFPVLGGHLREPGGQRGILYIYTHKLVYVKN
jgi:hypothetical protein